jgi:zinc D-Ala-D-Ala dipeptidase
LDHPDPLRYKRTVTEREQTYWTETMDGAWEFSRRVETGQLVECGEPLVCVATTGQDADVPLDLPTGLKLGLFERMFYLRQTVMDKLLSAAEGLRSRGIGVRVLDAYRTMKTQIHGARERWCHDLVLKQVQRETGLDRPPVDHVYRRLAAWTALTPKFANHTAGSAFDVQLFDIATGDTLDMGGEYPECTIRTPMDSPFISATQRTNRQLLRENFENTGLRAYPFEFWHFSFGDVDWALLTDSELPAQFGPVEFDPIAGTLAPITDLTTPLLTVEQLAHSLGDRVS